MAPTDDELVRLTQSLDAATAESQQARKASDDLAAELAAERLWRWVTALFAVVLLGGIVVLTVYLVVTVTHEDTIIRNQDTIIATQKRLIQAVCEVRHVSGLCP